MAEQQTQEEYVQEVTIQRPKRAQLTAEESLRRMEAFPERQEKIIAAVRKSRKQVPPLLSAFLLMALSQMLCGCSGVDALRISNNFPFAVRLWHSDHKLIGSVPAQGEKEFSGAGGYEGDGPDYIKCTDERNKTLGTLRAIGSNIHREDISLLNGAAVLSVTIGPPKLVSSASSSFAQILSAYWAPITIVLAVSIVMLKRAFDEYKRLKKIERPR